MAHNRMSPERRELQSERRRTGRVRTMERRQDRDRKRWERGL